jgi:hypothetical protein
MGVRAYFKTNDNLMREVKFEKPSDLFETVNASLQFNLSLEEEDDLYPLLHLTVEDYPSLKKDYIFENDIGLVEKKNGEVYLYGKETDFKEEDGKQEPVYNDIVLKAFVSEDFRIEFEEFLKGEEAKYWIEKTEQEIQERLKREFREIEALVNTKQLTEEDKKELKELENIKKFFNPSFTYIEIDLPKLKEIIEKIEVVREQNRELENLISNLEKHLKDYPLLFKYGKEDLEIALKYMKNEWKPVNQNSLEKFEAFITENLFRKYLTEDYGEEGVALTEREQIEILKKYDITLERSFKGENKNVIDLANEYIKKNFKKELGSVFKNPEDLTNIEEKIKRESYMLKTIKDFYNEEDIIVKAKEILRRIENLPKKADKIKTFVENLSEELYKEVKFTYPEEAFNYLVETKKALPFMDLKAEDIFLEELEKELDKFIKSKIEPILEENLQGKILQKQKNSIDLELEQQRNKRRLR